MITHDPQSRLLQLPGELLIEVLKRLDLKSLLRCRVSCAALHDLIGESMQLRYNIELAADGLVNGVGCNLPVAERYDLLMERRRRWRYLDFTAIQSFMAPGMCQAYELVDGVFASSRGVGFSGSRHISMTWLPTASQPSRNIEREDIGFTVRDFAMDPSQDLIALVLTDEPVQPVGHTILVRVRTMSDNKPHPNAAVSELSVPVPFPNDRSFIQIVDDIIGMFFWIHDLALVLWNWRTGKIVAKCVGPDLPLGAYDFAFLSKRSFMITVTGGGPGSIVIYTFSGDTDGTGSQPEQARAPPMAERLPPTKVAVLHLPPVKTGQGPMRFQTHSAPFVARPTPGRPFETSPDCRLHVMELNYGEHGMRYNIFVRNASLLSFVPPGVGSGATYEPVTRHWDEWGPDNTRFNTIVGRFQWLRYVHGERVIMPPVPTLGFISGAAVIMMFDFNVHPKRLDDAHSLWHKTSDVSTELITTDRPVVEEGIFESPVVTRLPFLLVIRKRPRPTPDYSGFMIDHDHLVGMRTLHDDEDVDLDVFNFGV
ncbi:hypothetical protein BC628DRAFT_438168 [Trametes gibbosa]|nr:hypothetical protein BC628DRAFT_438168 [Trametes gibbosa]